MRVNSCLKMDSNMLFQAAREGKFEVLERLLEENPSILADIRLTSLGESVLHVATKSGQLNFVHELMKVDPDLSGELNKDGFRPLDIAVVMGNVAIVKNLLSFDRDLGRLKGKANRTALHYAAVKGRVEIIDELLSTCPDCLQDITVQGETALHLAAKNYQFDAFADLVKWVERLSKESIINIQDGDGNTVLHLAVSTKQYACLNLLLDEKCSIRGTIELNVPNAKGLTALDISDIVIQDSYDAKARETLQLGGAVRAQDSTTITAQQSPQLETNAQPIQPSRNWFKYFKFQMQRDSPGDTRNALLVVATLIATVSFQAGVDPPSGLFDKSQKSNSSNQTPQHLAAPAASPMERTNSTLGLSPSGVSFLAGLAASFGSLGTDVLFLFANSLGFTASICIIIYLTGGFPFQRELHISLYSMMFTYGFAINKVVRTAKEKDKTMAYVLSTVASVLPFALRWLPTWGKEAWNYRRRRAARNARLPDVR